MTKSAVSHQLSTLKEAKLVRARREGKEVYYSLDDEHVKEIFETGIIHVTHICKEHQKGDWYYIEYEADGTPFDYGYIHKSQLKKYVETK